MAKRKTAKRTRYTDEFRANAVAAAIAAGYPSVKGALSHTAAQFSIPHQLLRNWCTSQQNPPPQNLLQEKKKDLRDLFLDELYAAAGILPTKRGEASYSQLVIAIATMFDKVRLIDGMPTEIVGMIPDLVEFNKLVQRKGYTLQDLIRANTETLSELPDKEMLTTGSGVN